VDDMSLLLSIYRGLGVEFFSSSIDSSASSLSGSTLLPRQSSPLSIDAGTWRITDHAGVTGLGNIAAGSTVKCRVRNASTNDVHTIAFDEEKYPIQFYANYIWDLMTAASQSTMQSTVSNSVMN
jgi:hypothetical protein